VEVITTSIPPATTGNTSPVSDKLAQFRADFLRAGEFIKKAIKQANISDVKSQAVRMRDWLIIARTCIEHRKLAKKLNTNWSVWLKENIPAYSRRTIEDYCRLAKIPKIEDYLVLGKVRLMYLVSNIDDDSRSASPIGDLLRDLDIQFNPEDATPEDEFKKNLDVAIQKRDLENAGITGVDVNLLEKLIAKGTPLNPRNVRELKLVMETNGDVNEYMKAMYENDGSITLGVRNHLSYRHINDLATRIDEIISEHKENADFIGEVDAEIISSLSTKLEDLMGRLERRNSAA